MSNPKEKIKKIKFDDLDLKDHTAETRFIHNNTENYETYQKLLAAPIRVLERLALGAFFTSKDEFESDPMNLGPMDCKLVNEALMCHLQTIEGLLKAFKRHGEYAVLDGDATVIRKDKETGEIDEIIELTALENMLQAATIGTYVEAVCNAQQAGPEEKVRLLNRMLRNTEDNSDTIIKDEADMKAFLKRGDKIEGLMKALMMDYGKEIHIKEIFETPRELAEALSNHKDGTEDFMIAYKRGLHTKLTEMDPIDRNILAKKAEELTEELREQLLVVDFPSK